MASKGSKVGEILDNVGGFCDRQCGGVIASGKCVVHSEGVGEGMQPEFHGHVSSCAEECLDSVCNCLMSLFCWSVLAGCISSGGMNCAPGFCEEVFDFQVVEWFTPLIHAHMFASALWVALRKEMLQP